MKLKKDFLELLRTDPEFYEEVRRTVLTDEILNLPALVRELTQAVRESAERTDRQIAQLTEDLRTLTARVNQLTEDLRTLTARVNQLTARVDQLTEDVRALTARVDQLTEDVRALTARVDQLTENMQVLTARVDQLTARVDQLTEDVRALTARVDQLTARVDQLTEDVRQLTLQVSRLAGQVGRLSGEVGGLLEIKYRQHPYGYFGGILRRARWVAGDELEDLLESAAQMGQLTAKEVQVLRMTDVIVRGFREGRTVWLAVEVSGTIDRDDIQRALERAALLARCVPDEVLPVVAGISCPEEVREGALRVGVWVVQDGQVFAPASQEANR